MVKINCPHCNGLGKIELPEHLEKVLSLVKKGRRTAEAVHNASTGDLVTVNAINNRLTDLLKLGLVIRHREGRYWHYNAAK